MTTTPRISVILPVYNTPPDWLREAIDSILSQTFRDFELLIVNDGSTDDQVVQTVRSYSDARIRYFEKDNTGIADTLNFALERAHGEFVARMDADDVSLPQRFERQVAYLEGYPDVALVGSWFEQFPIGQVVRYPENFTRLELGAIGNRLAHPTVMFRRTAFLEHGLRYDPKWVPAEDVELWMRASKVLKLANVPEVLLRYRLHPTSISAGNRKDQYAKADALQRTLLDECSPGLTVHDRSIPNVVALSGGLGNQMFQYAFGRAIGARFDILWYGGGQERMHTYSRYALDELEVPVDLLAPGELMRACQHNRFLKCFHIWTGLRLTYEPDERHFVPELLKMRRRRFQGYFQNERYFASIRADLLRAFRLRQSPGAAYDTLREKIRSVNAISVHVRRGDYLKFGDIYANLGLDYYRRAIEYIKERVASPVFFVFSDDIPWARENLSSPGVDLRFVDENWGIVSGDMMLMRECRHNIIANSTYSWWGAWLNENPNKIVIAPKKWFANGESSQIAPEGWCQL